MWAPGHAVGSWPTVVVCDDFHLALKTYPPLATQLLWAWNEHLAGKPVIPVVAGSDVHALRGVLLYGERSTSPSPPTSTCGTGDAVSALVGRRPCARVRCRRRYARVSRVVRSWDRAREHPPRPAGAPGSLGLPTSTVERCLDCLRDHHLVERIEPVPVSYVRGGVEGDARSVVGHHLVTFYYRHVEPQVEAIAQGEVAAAWLRIARRFVAYDARRVFLPFSHGLWTLTN